MAEFGQRFHDPLTAYDFSMEGEGGFGRVSGCWSKIGALEGEADIMEYRCGDDSATMRKAPGLVNYEDVECERGMQKAFQDAGIEFAHRKVTVELPPRLKLSADEEKQLAESAGAAAIAAEEAEKKN